MHIAKYFFKTIITLFFAIQKAYYLPRQYANNKFNIFYRVSSAGLVACLLSMEQLYYYNG